MASNILVVDDEKEIADLVELYLLNEGYDVSKFYSPAEALEYLEGNLPDLAVLDVMMPEIDGFELCRRIRTRHNYPIIMLTAKVEDIDKITGLAIGADDYVTKPFNPLEVVARVKAQLRRVQRYSSPREVSDDVIDFDGLIINRKTHECTYNEQSISLTPTEFSILWFLCENRGQVISSERLFETIWGEKYFNNNNTVMVHIRHIREKMNEPAGSPKIIKTVWGVGYKVEG